MFLRNVAFIVLFFYFLEMNADEMIHFNQTPKDNIESSLQKNVNLWENKNAKPDSIEFVPESTQESSQQDNLDSKDSTDSNISQTQKDLADSKDLIESNVELKEKEQKDSKTTESKQQNSKISNKNDKKLQKELEKQQKLAQKQKEKELKNQEKQAKKQQQKQEKLLKKAEKNKKHITNGKNIQEVKTKRDFGILGSSISLGANAEMLGVRATWSALDTATQPQMRDFSTNIKMQNLGLTWGYQFVGRKLHLLAETRLNIGYNFAKSDLDVLLGGDALLGYYFPFNSFSGIALKAGGGVSFGFNSKKVSEMVQNEAFSAVSSRDILTFLGVTSKFGLELNVARIGFGAYFVYYHFYMASFENMSDNFTPLNSNANAKSGGYGFQATLVYRFKKSNTHLYDLQR